MHVLDIDRMFRFTIEKTSTEIKMAAQLKIEKLKSKIVEREQRLAALRKEYEIDDSALIQLLTAARRANERGGRESFSYTSSNKAVKGTLSEERTIGAGVVNNLLTENDFLESEKDSVKQLQQVVKNIRPLERHAANSGEVYTIDSFAMTAEELEYLEF